jgi:hypothetical protein
MLSFKRREFGARMCDLFKDHSTFLVFVFTQSCRDRFSMLLRPKVILPLLQHLPIMLVVRSFEDNGPD